MFLTVVKNAGKSSFAKYYGRFSSSLSFLYYHHHLQVIFNFGQVFSLPPPFLPPPLPSLTFTITVIVTCVLHVCVTNKPSPHYLTTSSSSSSHQSSLNIKKFINRFTENMRSSIIVMIMYQWKYLLVIRIIIY